MFLVLFLIIQPNLRTVEKDVLRNFSKFSQNGWACNFIKKETLTQCFPVNFAKFIYSVRMRENEDQNNSE